MMTAESRKPGTLPYAVHEALRSMGIRDARLVSTDSDEVIRIEPDERRGYLPGHAMDVSYQNLYAAVDVTLGPDGRTFRCYEAFQDASVGDCHCSCCKARKPELGLQRTNASFTHVQKYAIIEPPRLFAVRQSGIVFDPTGDEREMRMFAACYGFRLWLGQKPYFEEPIAASFWFGSPEDADLKGPVKGFTELYDLPLIVPAQLPYHVELEGQPLGIKPFTLWVMLCGIMFRAVQ